MATVFVMVVIWMMDRCCSFWGSTRVATACTVLQCEDGKPQSPSEWDVDVAGSSSCGNRDTALRLCLGFWCPSSGSHAEREAMCAACVYG